MELLLARGSQHLKRIYFFCVPYANGKQVDSWCYHLCPALHDYSHDAIVNINTLPFCGHPKLKMRAWYVHSHGLRRAPVVQAILDVPLINNYCLPFGAQHICKSCERIFKSVIRKELEKEKQNE